MREQERGGGVSHTSIPAGGHAQLTPTTSYTLQCVGSSAEWVGVVTTGVLVPLFELVFI